VRVIDVAGLFTLKALLAAIAGGVIGASVGGLPSFSFAGLVIVVGEAVKLTQDSVAKAAAGTSPEALNAVGLTGAIGLGPVLGPHTAFAGGVAAAAYAGRKDGIETDFDYHPAKNVTTSLGTEPDVLAVGAIFGVVGLVITKLSATLALPWDPIAMSIVLSAFIHRLAFGYPLIGDVESDWLDMQPFERNERRHAATDGGQADAESAITQNARFVVEPWLPHQYEWANVSVLGFGVGLFGGFVAIETGSPFLAFGITAASLIFLNLGMEKMPITHHMALPASIAALSLPGVAPAVAVLVGGVFGLLGGLTGELAQRVLYAHADTHLDPPAAAIVVTTLVIGVLSIAGVFTQPWIPTLGL
jgi:hypothetical protein